MSGEKGRFGCVIMASGLGIRFGSNKLMTEFRGHPLIGRALDVTEGIFAGRVVVTRHKDVADYCRERNAEVILHSFPHRSDTVRIGLEQMKELEGCMFFQGDQPLLKKETVVELLQAADRDREVIWRPVCEQNQGTPVFFPKRLFEELLSLPEGKGGGYVIKKYPELVHTVPVRDMYELMDVDTQEDLRILLER